MTPMDLVQAFETLAIAVGAGMLIGLQRERDRSALGGIRTFPLIALTGAAGAMLHPQLGPWALVVGGIGVIAATAMGNIAREQTEGPSPGITTEIAILVTFLSGALLGAGEREIGVALAAITAVLLHAKATLHRFAERVGDHDLRAVLQFVVITFIVLPVLPDRTMGPFDVLNPREIWLMVVLVVGLSLAGYIAYRLLGERHGTAAAGLLGGMISSTATTVSYARREREGGVGVWAAAVAITLASSIAFIRVIIEIGVAAPDHVRRMAWPFAVMFAILLVAGVAMLLRLNGRHDTERPTPQNPSELKAALIFGALYAGVLLAVAAARKWFGEDAIYGVAVLSGLTDMDAITLSTSRMVQGGQLSAETGWRAILVASMANLAFKGGFVAVLAKRNLTGAVWAVFGAAMLAGAAMMVFWPAPAAPAISP